MKISNKVFTVEDAVEDTVDDKPEFRDGDTVFISSYDMSFIDENESKFYVTVFDKYWNTYKLPVDDTRYVIAPSKVMPIIKNDFDGKVYYPIATSKTSHDKKFYIEDCNIDRIVEDNDLSNDKVEVNDCNKIKDDCNKYFKTWFMNNKNENKDNKNFEAENGFYPSFEDAVRKAKEDVKRGIEERKALRLKMLHISDDLMDIVHRILDLAEEE